LEKDECYAARNGDAWHMTNRQQELEILLDDGGDGGFAD
jgi:hypothetical protein